MPIYQDHFDDFISYLIESLKKIHDDMPNKNLSQASFINKFMDDNIDNIISDWNYYFSLNDTIIGYSYALYFPEPVDYHGKIVFKIWIDFDYNTCCQVSCRLESMSCSKELFRMESIKLNVH